VYLVFGKEFYKLGGSVAALSKTFSLDTRKGMSSHLCAAGAVLGIKTSRFCGVIFLKHSSGFFCNTSLLLKYVLFSIATHKRYWRDSSLRVITTTVVCLYFLKFHCR